MREHAYANEQNREHMGRERYTKPVRTCSSQSYAENIVRVYIGITLTAA